MPLPFPGVFFVGIGNCGCHNQILENVGGHYYGNKNLPENTDTAEGIENPDHCGKACLKNY